MQWNLVNFVFCFWQKNVQLIGIGKNEKLKVTLIEQKISDFLLVYGCHITVHMQLTLQSQNSTHIAPANSQFPEEVIKKGIAKGISQSSKTTQFIKGADFAFK